MIRTWSSWSMSSRSRARTSAGCGRAMTSGKTNMDRHFHHREVGDLILNWELFNVNSAPGQQLLIFQAEQASPSEHALALLGSLAVMTV